MERELKASVYDAATDYLRTGLLTPEVSLYNALAPHCRTLAGAIEHTLTGGCLPRW